MRATLRRLPRSAPRSAVSVVIPCYNYRHFVEAAVRSAVEQEGVDTEVIVVDDASSDGSADVICQLAERYGQVTAVIHEKNQGHIATFNDGLNRARHDFVLLLSADDMLAPGALARAAAIMRRYPSVGLVYGFAPDFDLTPPAQREVLPHCTLWRGSDWLTHVCRRGQNPVSTPAGVMRREILADVGGYSDKVPHTSDLLMWLQAAARFDVAYVNGVDQAYYRVHGANMHLTMFGQLGSDLAQRFEAFAVFVAESPQLPSGPAHLADAERALVREATQARQYRSRTDPSSPEDPSIVEFLQRHHGLEPLAPPSGIAAAPRAVRERLHNADATLRWWYWRRFGLRW